LSETPLEERFVSIFKHTMRNANMDVIDEVVKKRLKSQSENNQKRMRAIPAKGNQNLMASLLFSKILRSFLESVKLETTACI
jgi:hypothetical protein